MAASRRTNRGPTAGPANRAALVAAAREVFDSRGIAAPLSAVAKLAGVGQGSLYRHFPDRTSLAIAVLEENMRSIEALAGEPESTLRDVIDAAIHEAEGSAVLIASLTTEHPDARLQELRGRLQTAIETTWSAARESGRIGASTEVGDVMLAITMVALTVSHTPRERRHEVADAAWRLLEPGLVD